MAKRTKKLSKRSTLKLEALEARQLLAGVTGAGTEVGTDVHHANGNVYDQVKMTGSSVTVTNDAGQITRVSFLDMQGDIVQAEFSGAGTFTVSLEGAKTDQSPTGYVQDVKYVQGLATITATGTDAGSNIGIYSVGRGTAYVNQALFDGTHNGGDHTADVQRINIVADTANPNGSLFGGIRAGNAVFSASSGVVGISASNVQVQDLVRVGDIVAKDTATPMLVFGANSQFGDVTIHGGGLIQANGKTINNGPTSAYNFGVQLVDGTKSDGTLDAKENTLGQLSWTGNNPSQVNSKTINLTTSIDNLVGTPGDDTFNASHTAASAVVSSLDKLDGGAGSDVLNISDSTGAAPIGGLTVSNIETLQYTSTAGLGLNNSLSTKDWSGLTNSVLVLQNIGNTAQTVTASKDTVLNVTSTAGNIANNGASGTWGITGGKTVTLTQTTSGVGPNTSTGTVTVTGVQGTESVNVTQSGKAGAGTFGAVNVTDWANGNDKDKAGTITSVTLNGVDTASTITDNALTSLSLTKVTAAVTITDNLAAHKNSATTLAVTVNDSTTGITDTNGTIKQIDFTTAGRDSSAVITTANNALTTVTVAGEKALDLSGSTFGSNFATLTGTGNAGVKATVSKDVTVTTAAGSDDITVAAAATKKAISLGAGADRITTPLTSEGKLDGGSIDGGDGTDTLVLTMADAKKATEGTTLAGQITGVEKLELSGVAAAGSEINLHNLDDIKDIVITGANANAYTLSHVASGAAVTISTSNQTGATLTIDVPVSAVQSETLALKSTSDNTARDLGTIETGQINAINWATDNTNDNPTAQQHTVALSSNSLRTITVAGDAGATISSTGTGVTSIDGSGITKGYLQVTTGVLGAAATITGSGQDGDSITATAAGKAVTVNAGNGSNTIVIANANNNTITGGNKIDTVTVGSGNNTINTGDDADVINLNPAGNMGANTVNAGAGGDTINLGKGTGQTVLTLGDGTDAVVFAAGSVPTNAGYFVTVADAANDDTISFAAIKNGAVSTTLTKVSLGQGVSFSDYLNSATAGNGSVNSAVSWFQFGGDTYVVVDNGAGATFAAGTDMVIKLSGSLDLSGSGLASAITAGGVLTI